MIVRRVLAGLAMGVAGLMFLGCERSAPAPSPAPSPESPAAPAAPSAATAPATTTAASSQPANSVMYINEHMTVFPPARMRLESDGQHLAAIVFSDDPKDALKDNYVGNSFYLRMDLDVDDAAKLPDARWHYTAPSSGERDDSPYGIHLGAQKLQLQPYDVQGAFKVEGDSTDVLISGQFQVIDASAGRGPAQVIPVSGRLPVRVQSDVKKAPD
jgi:hypothetical protein